jgi:hypothetical protein
MLNKSLLLICLILSLTSCFSPSRDSKYLHNLNRVTYSHNRSLEKEGKLELLKASSFTKNNEGLIQISYVSRNLLTPSEARALYVEVAEDLLERVNTDEKIRPLLHTYPLKIENILISIYFKDQFSLRVPKQYVGLLHNDQNRLCYYNFPLTPIYIKSNFKGTLEQFHEESYEEALEIVKNESSTIPI